MLNQVVLIGRLTKDPEMRYTQNGTAVTSFTLACDRPFTTGTGQREADFIPIVVWRKQAESCGKYLSKGSLTAVVGRIQTRSYDDQNGQKRYVTEVVADNVRFLPTGQGNPNGAFQPPLPDEPPMPIGGPMQSGIDSEFQPIEEDDDELPF
jgi:single-strand DNA-binding protein